MANDLDRILALRPGGSRPPLYCVHAVSGSAYSYAGLARLLDADQPVYGFEAPGFDNDRPPVSALPALAQEYTAILCEHQPEGPYRLLGWSLGGVVIFEMAKLLVASGRGVAALVLVDAGLPEVMDLPPEREILRRYIRDMTGHSDVSPPGLDDLSTRWPPDVEPKVVFEEVVEAGILAEEIDADLLDNQYGVFRAHLKGFYSIALTGTYEGPTVHILAEQSPAADMNWRRLTPNLTEHTVSGTHHSIWAGDGLVAMSKIVSDVLNRV
nr:alpha/beta fold hydrolase [Micromonospora sp. DSM 115978]